jgi:hypothetical protein
VAIKVDRITLNSPTTLEIVCRSQNLCSGGPLMLAAANVSTHEAVALPNSCSRYSLTWSHSAAYSAVGRSDCAARPGQQHARGHGVVCCRSRAHRRCKAAAMAAVYQVGKDFPVSPATARSKMHLAQPPSPAIAAVGSETYSSCNPQCWCQPQAPSTAISSGSSSANSRCGRQQHSARC